MIRPAVRRDVPTLAAMAHRFHQSSPAAFLDFDFRAAVGMASVAVGGDQFFAIVLDIEGPKGALIAQAQPYALGRQVLAKEIVFWIEPEYRGPWARRMIFEYEAWAASRGAVACGLSCFADGRTVKLFERAGFAPFEVHTMKRI